METNNGFDLKTIEALTADLKKNAEEIMNSTGEDVQKIHEKALEEAEQIKADTEAELQELITKYEKRALCIKERYVNEVIQEKEKRLQIYDKKAQARFEKESELLQISLNNIQMQLNENINTINKTGISIQKLQNKIQEEDFKKNFSRFSCLYDQIYDLKTAAEKKASETTATQDSINALQNYDILLSMIEQFLREEGVAVICPKKGEKIDNALFEITMRIGVMSRKVQQCLSCGYVKDGVVLKKARVVG